MPLIAILSLFSCAAMSGVLVLQIKPGVSLGAVNVITTGLESCKRLAFPVAFPDVPAYLVVAMSPASRSMTGLVRQR